VIAQSTEVNLINGCVLFAVGVAESECNVHVPISIPFHSSSITSYQ